MLKKLRNVLRVGIGSKIWKEIFSSTLLEEKDIESE